MEKWSMGAGRIMVRYWRRRGSTAMRTLKFFFSSRRRHTRYWRDWSSDVCSSDLDRDCGAQSAPPLPPERPGDHKYGRGNIGRRCPVGLGPRQQADSEHHCERRQGEGSEQAGAALGETAGAGSDREQRCKAQRAEYGELRGEEFEKSAGMEQHAADLGIVADMPIADKIVMPVPPEVRQVQYQRDEARAERPGQMPPLLAHQEHIAERREKPVRHRIFGEKAEPRSNPDRNPPSLAARLTRPDECVECCRPAWQQHGVGRDQKSRKRDAGQGDVRQGGPEAGATVIEPRRNPIDKGGGAQFAWLGSAADSITPCMRRRA